MKDEGPFILEWIAWNQMIGVNHFIVMTNDCSDGTDLILDRLDEMGIVTHLPNPVMLLDGGSVHSIALRYAQHLRVYRQADWIFHTDVDEFLNIHTAEGDLPSLVAAAGNAEGQVDAISICETLLGCGGVEGFVDEPVTRQFLHGMRRHALQGEERRGVKTLFRNKNLWRGRKNHRPIVKRNQIGQVRWTDGSGKPAPEEFVNGKEPGLDCNGRYGLAALHHYSVRSMESLLAKLRRGDAVKSNRTKGWKYWRKRNQNIEPNDDMLAKQPALAKEIARLKADPILSDLHARAVTQHKHQIAEMLVDAEMQEMIEFYRRTIWGDPDFAK
ncbi:MAG: glycosyltransferase family 2 protein [Pikeienuella sp.]